MACAAPPKKLIDVLAITRGFRSRVRQLGIGIADRPRNLDEREAPDQRR